MLIPYIYLFSIIYPLAFVAENSSLFSPEMAPLSQTLRHLLVIGAGSAALLNYRRVFQLRRLNEVTLWVAAGSSLAIVLGAIKVLLGADLPLQAGYHALEPLLVIVAASGISSSSRGMKIFLRLSLVSLVASILAFAALHYVSGEQIIASHYNRPRLTLGFNHPGKLAQHIGIAFLVLLYFFDASRRGARILRNMALVALAFLLLETGTRTMIIIATVAVLFKASARLRAREAGAFRAALMGIGVLAAVVLYLIIPPDLQHLLLSGRVAWAMKGISNNFEHYGASILFFGATGPLIANSADALQVLGRDPIYAVRFDNGFVEMAMQSGIFVLLFLLIALVRLGMRVSGRVSDRTALALVLVIFGLSEAGFFAVGNFFGTFVLIMLVCMLRKETSGTVNLHYPVLRTHSDAMIPARRLRAHEI